MVILMWFRSQSAILNELNSFAALVLVRGADFPIHIRQASARCSGDAVSEPARPDLLSAKYFGGLAVSLAVLVLPLTILPRFSGCWLALAGFAWVILSLTSTLLPQYQDRVNSYLQPAIIGRLCSCCGC